MPTYEITSPDGRRFEVTAPAGATQEQIMAMVAGQSNVQEPKPAPQGRDFGFLGGAVRGLRDSIDAGAQMMTRGLEAIAPAGSRFERFMQDERKRVENINTEAEKDYINNWRGGQAPSFDAGRLFGNIALTAPLAPSGVAATLAGRVAQGAASGAALGTLQPVQEGGDFWSEKAKQAALGGAFGAAAAPVTSMIGRVVSPNTSDKVRDLMDAGVTPTPGQILGGMPRRIEENMRSVPVLGSVIRGAEQRAVQEFDTAAINKALFPLGKSVPKNVTGNDAIQFAETSLRDAYDSALNKIKTPAIDNKLLSDLSNLRSMLGNQPKDMAQRLEHIIDNEILARTDQGRLTGEAIKKAESNLGSLARGLGRSQDYDTRILGDAVEEAQRSLRSWLERVAPPDAARDLQKANAGWAAFKRVQRAASSVAAEDGIFTPAQLHNAVKAMDYSKDKASFARGDALLQDLSSAGKSILGNKVPDSGTPERAMTAGLLGLLGGVATGTASIPWTAAAAAAPLAAYLPGGRQMSAALLARRPGFAEPLADSIRYLSPALGASLSPMGKGLLE